ncbi:hypothetical protein L6452_07746, partial [Arctium lappa]
ASSPSSAVVCFFSIIGRRLLLLHRRPSSSSSSSSSTSEESIWSKWEEIWSTQRKELVLFFRGLCVKIPKHLETAKPL